MAIPEMPRAREGGLAKLLGGRRAHHVVLDTQNPNDTGKLLPVVEEFMMAGGKGGHADATAEAHEKNRAKGGARYNTGYLHEETPTKEGEHYINAQDGTENIHAHTKDGRALELPVWDTDYDTKAEARALGNLRDELGIGTLDS